MNINNIDIVGNVKIFGLLRLKYFIAVLRSIVFLKDNANVWINIENGKLLVKPVERYLRKLGFVYGYAQRREQCLCNELGG